MSFPFRSLYLSIHSPIVRDFLFKWMNDLLFYSKAGGFFATLKSENLSLSKVLDFWILENALFSNLKYLSTSIITICLASFFQHQLLYWFSRIGHNFFHKWNGHDGLRCSSMAGTDLFLHPLSCVVFYYLYISLLFTSM